MDEPARKRRKTASPELGNRASSPLKQPPRRLSFASHSRHTSPLKVPPRRPSVSPTKSSFNRASSPLKEPPRRPSFVSPTKASLARSYPNLLPPRPSSSDSAASKPSARGDVLALGKQARANAQGDQNTQSYPAQEDISEDKGQRRKSRRHDVTPRARRTTGKTGIIAMGNVYEEDADLPTSSAQLNSDEVDTPRRGILYSSPSKRPKKLKDAAQQSPLRRKAHNAQEDKFKEIEDGLVEVKEAQAIEEKEKEPPDSEIEKKKQEQAQLMRELNDLEDQVAKCAEEIVNIQKQSAIHVLQPAEREDLITFVNQIAKASTEAEEEAPAVSSLLCSFLPYSMRSILSPKSRQTQPQFLASHQPLDLEDPQPYLEMFTAFKFTTQLNFLQDKFSLNSNKVLQKHLIEITGPQKLLAASLSIIIDTLTNTISDLKIVHLSSWAERELGAFLRKEAQDKDLGNACWAISSYWEIAKKRAEYWHRCETSFGYLIPGRASDDTENISQLHPQKTISRRNLGRYLGRDTLVLEDRHVMLKVSWSIEFDWTGEAGSQISIEHAVPHVWIEADINSSFKKIPETFDSLVRSNGLFVATKTMAALLFQDQTM